MGFWWILLVFIILIPLIFFGNQNWRFNRNQSVSKESPLDILDRKYAYGEIDTKEYRERKEELLNR